MSRPKQVKFDNIILKEYITNNNINIKEMPNKINYEPYTIRNYLNGTMPLTARFVYRFTQAYNAPPLEYFIKKEW